MQQKTSTQLSEEELKLLALNKQLDTAQTEYQRILKEKALYPPHLYVQRRKGFEEGISTLKAQIEAIQNAKPKPKRKKTESEWRNTKSLIELRKKRIQAIQKSDFETAKQISAKIKSLL